MSRLKRRLLWVSVAGIAGVALVAPLGCGGESQFSPVTFEHRGVRTYHIPYTDVRLWSTPGEPYRKRIVQFWIDEGYLKPETSPTERWDVITGWVSAPGWRLSRSGSAKSFWYHAGCQDGEAAESWIHWSRRHPELAADLWPRVVGLLQQAAHRPGRSAWYAAAAVLMDSVQQVEDAKTYRERVAEWDREWAKELATL
jgi:hypothetical protein